ncbi:hypothetical protein M9H77_35536 [Catharanthus roseus]|uniref:Uncharacterized protein n=1 Tax=Catharanthus roseus TaxID=4058 RepID=A0ACB9ZQK1_CATRO|nr:hypothetical protein M9H77_35536 [Catharanthus roseus]
MDGFCFLLEVWAYEILLMENFPLLNEEMDAFPRMISRSTGTANELSSQNLIFVLLIGGGSFGFGFDLFIYYYWCQSASFAAAVALEKEICVAGGPAHYCRNLLRERMGWTFDREHWAQWSGSLEQ